MSHYFSEAKRYLNGAWDFLPVYSGDPGTKPPRSGWLEAAYQVPSMWGKVGHFWRVRGEAHYRRGNPPEGTQNVEYFCDCFGYPEEWNRTRTAWVRRRFQIDELQTGRRIHLCFEALGPRAQVYVNGKHVAAHADAFLPLEVDVTEALASGENELAVLILPYPLHRDRMLIPSGNELTVLLSGVWQDCYLVASGEQHVLDTCIRTSTRKQRLELELSLVNKAKQSTELSVGVCVHGWLPDGGMCVEDLRLPQRKLSLSPQETHTLNWNEVWKDARWWDPVHPHLYWLVVEVRVGDQIVDTFRERFGFREIWLEGPDLMLNDHPIHLASDWGHKAGIWNYTTGWIQKWLGMIRDANMNHSRLHTHPHPRLLLDQADEQGILLTAETAIHGSGNAQAVDHEEFWVAARKHLEAFIARDRNRPSVILWSLENEMRFEREGAALVRRELPLLRKLANTLDPTRIAYHEGDSMIWDESSQDLISRHYGRICSGLGWWKQTQPLHSGEMSLHHLSGPNVAIQFLGDEGWKDYRLVTKAVTDDARQVIEGGRTIGVCCFGPWNLSALENYRRDTADVNLSWPDETAPGIKPRSIPAYSSEFSFWKPGKGYTPAPSFAIQAQAFRPVALIDLSMRTVHVAGRPLARRLHLVNDGSGSLRCTLRVRLVDTAGAIYGQRDWYLEVPRGRRVSVEWKLALPGQEGEYSYEAACLDSSGVSIDSWSRRFSLRQLLCSQSPLTKIGTRVALVGGDDTLRGVLSTLDCTHEPVSGPEEARQQGFDILLVGANAIRSSSAWTAPLRQFLAAGGRVVLLEQSVGVLPGAELQEKAVSAAFRRRESHPLLQDIAAEDLAWWGEDPYAQLNPDHLVARRMYRKDDGSSLDCVVDSGEGTFGDGDLEYAALIENAPPSGGLLLACQLEVGAQLDCVPAAQVLLRNLLLRAKNWSPRATEKASAVVRADADAKVCVARAKAGETILVEGLDSITIPHWAAATGLDLRLRDVGDIYQFVRATPDPLLEGISNSDLCGIDNWIYGSNTEPAKVALHALAPCAGMESLLETPRDSLLREFYVHQGRTEFLRAHTASRFLFEERPEAGVGLGRVRIGSGQILFWQFTAGDAQRLRCGRAQRLLRRNLGLLRPGSLLTGEPPSGSEGSPGYPTQLWVLAEDMSDQELNALRNSTVRANDTKLPERILGLKPWKPLVCPEGIVRAADCGAGRPILLYTRLRSPKRRFCSDADLGVPNPDTFTYCELTGDGVAQMTMDAYTFLPTDLFSGEGTVKDMAMDLGYNQSLLAWWPKSRESTLRIRWRNSIMQPETSFGFV